MATAGLAEITTGSGLMAYRLHPATMLVLTVGLLVKIIYFATVYDCMSVQNLTGLMCGHEFCRNCWCQYLTVKIMDEGMGQVSTSSCLQTVADFTFWISLSLRQRRVQNTD